MAKLSYSNDAENVLDKFHSVDMIVHVEGTDDIVFWEFIFSQFADYSVKMIDVGGFPEVEKYITKIVAGEITAIVACDADFSYTGIFPQHPNVLRSYGYSIENSMICHKTLKKIIGSIGRIPLLDINDGNISQWFERLAGSTKNLVIHDVANHKMKTGISIAGNNCDKFMKSSTSAEVCARKIKNHLSDVDLNMSKELEIEIINSIVKSNRTEADFLRGHFLFSASRKYVISEIKKSGKNVPISNGSFFGALLMAFENVFNKNHSHYNYYQHLVSMTKLSA